MERISLGYAPRPAFVEFHKRKQRWACLVCHRRAGKTVACVADLIDAALRCEKPNPRFAYLAPFYTQAKDVAWTYVKLLTQNIPGSSINESELRVDLPNGARIRLYGADNCDRLRGLFLDGIVLDEYADMNPRAWPEVLRPTLSDRKGWAVFIGTPKGRNAFFDMYDLSLEDDTWFSMMLKADDSGIIESEELEDVRKSMTAEQYEQEYLCSFDAAILGAYYGKDMADAEKEGRICEVPHDPGLPVYTAWDLGMRDSTAIWFYQIAPDELRFIDYYENHTQPLAHYVSIIRDKGYSIPTDYVPHDAKVKELGTGKTRIETLIEMKRNPKLVPEHKVLDGINAARVLFRRMKFDRHKCADGIEALRQYKADFDEDRNTFRKEPRHDWTSHAADAFRYACIAYRDFVLPKEKPKKQGVTLNDLWASQKQRTTRI
jgi:phage terminase large subunit